MMHKKAVTIPHESSARRKQVMVIDHEPASSLRLADWLAVDGYETIIARQLGDVAELLADLEPDIILLDLYVPLIYGLEALRMIRTAHPHVPIVTMAEPALLNVAVQCLKRGANAYLLKPFEPYHVGKLLHAEIERSMLLS
jgi:CheY-like chemotaxis protein